MTAVRRYPILKLASAFWSITHSFARLRCDLSSRSTAVNALIAYDLAKRAERRREPYENLAEMYRYAELAWTHGDFALLLKDTETDVGAASFRTANSSLLNKYSIL
jgi:hypothetical protein